MNNKIDQVKNAENEAVILLNHAMALAKASTSSDELEIVSVLDSNLKLWVEIETSLKSAKNLLPEDIRILDIQETSSDFNARYNAKKKQYDYIFYTGMQIPVYDSIATYIGYNLDINKMQDACKYIVGTHDFSSFCASNTDIKDKVREVYSASIQQVDDNLYRFSICGNGFLYNMVRIIMGTLVSVGMGKLEPKDIESIINSHNRNKAGKTMPAKGLYLKKVIY